MKDQLEIILRKLFYLGKNETIDKIDLNDVFSSMIMRENRTNNKAFMSDTTKEFIKKNDIVMAIKQYIDDNKIMSNITRHSQERSR